MTEHLAQDAAAKDKALIFLHIPKAAGSTLQSVIARQFAPDVAYSIFGSDPHGLIKDLINLPLRERLRIRLLSGHMPYGLHRHLSAPSIYITMLRDPVDRIISHYFFVLNYPDHYLHKEVASGNMSLLDYARSGMSTELSNDQTRLISGVEKVNSRLLDGRERRTLQASREPVTAEILEIAKKNLEEHFTGFGLVSRFDESLLLFKRRLGWRNIYYVRHNVTKNRPRKQQVSREIRDLIARHNEMDAELYEYAQQKFEEAIKEQGAGFKNELRVFRRNNRLYGKGLAGCVLAREAVARVKAVISRRPKRSERSGL